MMKKLLSLLQFLGFAILSACARPAERPPFTSNPSTAMSVYDFKMIDLEGKAFDLHQLKGKKILFVNTASECGYTPQYADLQKLQDSYSDKITVVGIPCNQFGGQEPGTSGEIRSFCTKRFQVTFPMMEKSTVRGEKKSPLYQWLTDKSQNGWNADEPSWNFCKYLIDENGQLIGFYPSSVNPMDDKIISKLK